jgi:hypothetical protein
MDTIDVRGLPEPAIDALNTMVDCLRQKTSEPAPERRAERPIKIATWPGQVLGPLTREEIYGERC